jgi:hypothetical protein
MNSKNVTLHDNNLCRHDEIVMIKGFINSALLERLGLVFRKENF